MGSISTFIKNKYTVPPLRQDWTYFNFRHHINQFLLNERIADYKIYSIKYQQEDDTRVQHDGHLPGKCDGMCDNKCPADQGPAPALQWSGGSNDTPVTAPHNSQHSQQQSN